MKKIALRLPFPVTANLRYDLLTKKILKQHLGPESNCIDVGTHTGEILDLFLQYAPGGHHYGFEPLPHLYEELVKKYSNESRCTIYPLAIADIKAKSSFNYVFTNPAYSGLKKRRYDRPGEKETTIEVQTELLDNLIPGDKKISLIKIDVEGGEFQVLQGARHLLARSRPLVIFECGLGGSDFYGTTPDMIFSFFAEQHYALSLLDDFLSGKNPLSAAAFNREFAENKNYYFIAHPAE